MDDSNSNIELHVFRNDTLLFATSVDKPLEIGRQKPAEPVALARVSGGAVDRVVVAPLSESQVSRSQMLIEACDGFSVRLINTSRSRIILLENGAELLPGESRIVGDICMKVHDLQIHIRVPAWQETEYASVSRPHQTQIVTSIESETLRSAASLRHLDVELSDQHQALLIQCFRALSAACLCACNSQENIASLTQAISDLFEFDRCVLYSYRDTSWATISEEDQQLEIQRWADSELARRILSEGTTIVRNPNSVRSSIASPLLDEDGQITGVLYAQRDLESKGPITRLEAKLVDLIAANISAASFRTLENAAKTVGKSKTQVFSRYLSGFRQRFGFPSEDQ